jgi:choline dehydrogenase
MYVVRPSSAEVDAWAAMVPGGVDKWSWDNLFAGMQASETFSAPSDSVQKAGNIQWNASSHGTSGPIHTTYPALCVFLFL